MTGYNVNNFGKSSLSVEKLSFFGRKLNLASHNGIDGMVSAKTDTLAWNKFCASLAYDNITRFNNLTIVQFYAKIFGLRISP